MARKKTCSESFTGALKVGDRVRDLNVKWYTDRDGRDPVSGGVGVIEEVCHREKVYWVLFDDGHDNARGEHELQKI